MRRLGLIALDLLLVVARFVLWFALVAFVIGFVTAILSVSGG